MLVPDDPSTRMFISVLLKSDQKVRHILIQEVTL